MFRVYLKNCLMDPNEIDLDKIMQEAEILYEELLHKHVRSHSILDFINYFTLLTLCFMFFGSLQEVTVSNFCSRN